MKPLLLILFILSIGFNNSAIHTGFGYWLFGADMKKVNLETLSKQGTTDIFLNFYAIQAHGEKAVVSWIAKANKLKIRIHIWMQVFNNGKWINPLNANINSIVDEAKKYARISGVSGVHFDYIRYPGTAHNNNGGTNKINEFVKIAVAAIHQINPKCIVSAALMPETTVSEYYYGQDYNFMSRYLDVVVPMIYKGNYGKDNSWIRNTASWYVKYSKGASVWAGIQSYRSDSDTTQLSDTQLHNDAQAGLRGGAKGVIIFRWGISHLLKFNSLNK